MLRAKRQEFNEKKELNKQRSIKNKEEQQMLKR